MMRKDSIDELLDEAKDGFSRLHNQRKNLRAKSQAIIGHLRSCLEYATQDINSKLSIPRVDTPRDKLYFPYGESPEALDKVVQKKLPLLKAERPDLFDEISKLHNFDSDNKWLKTLCSLNNHAKHKDAIEIKSDQEKVKTVSISSDGVNLVHACGNSKVTFSNYYINGKKIDDFVLDKGEINITKKGDLPLNYKITKDRKILVGDEEIDLLPFLDSSIKDIEIFVDKLYTIL